MTLEKKQQIIQTLTAKEALKPCPACGQSSITLADQLVCLLLEDHAGQFQVPGPMATLAMLLCRNCGHSSLHHVGVLGM
jgi:hypothetical protein